MLLRFLRKQSGVSSAERALYMLCLGMWCVIGLEMLGAVAIGK